MSAALRYQDQIGNPVAPGGGCHGWLLSTANLAKLAAIPAEQCFSDLRRVIPPGVRRIPDKEISDAIHKAFTLDFVPTARPKPLVDDGNAALAKIISQGKFSSETELIESSPIEIPFDFKMQQQLFFEIMFEWKDFIFIGDREDKGTTKTIRPQCEWLEVGAPGPFIIINPLSGYPAPKKDGTGESYRSDGCVNTYRHCLVEFDNIPLEDQIKFWSAAPLPVKALIHTGNKSIHAWLDLTDQNIRTPEQWNILIKEELYQKRLIPLGVDPACANPARLARLPGVYRTEKKEWQRLLWLAERGQNV
jgi:hypothetical protein